MISYEENTEAIDLFKGFNISRGLNMSPEEVKKVAHLARLAILSEEELTSYTQNLTDIMHLIDQLNAIDTSGIEPMSHPFDAVQRLREDKVSEPNQRDLLQSVAPMTPVEGLYLVPQVIE